MKIVAYKKSGITREDFGRKLGRKIDKMEIGA